MSGQHRATAQMGRRQRYFPNGSTVEVMARTHRATRLLRPSAASNALFVGVIGEALRRFGDWIQVHDIGGLSTHYHKALTLACQAAFEAYMQFVQSQLAVKLGLEVDWQAKLWGGRYSAGVVCESAQPLRRDYIWGQGLPERLFESPLDNPCVNSISALAAGEFALKGVWISKTRLSEAGVDWHDHERRAAFEEPREVPLHPWPMDRGKSRAQRQADAIEGAARLTAAQAKARGRRRVFGADRMRAVHPHTRTKNPQIGTGCPLVWGTAEEEATFKAAYAAEIEKRDRLMDDLVAGLNPEAWPEGLAMHSVLRVALRRRTAQAAKIRANLKAAGLEHLAEEAAAGWPALTRWVEPMPVVAPFVPPAVTWTRRMVRRQRPRGERVRLRARRRATAGRWADRRARQRQRRARSRLARRATQVVRVVRWFQVSAAGAGLRPVRVLVWRPVDGRAAEDGDGAADA